MLPLPLLPHECLSRATGIQSSWPQQGLFHRKSTVFLPSPCILFHMENAFFTESSGRAVLLGLFRFSPLPLVFPDEEQTHQKQIQTSGHGCEMACAQANHRDSLEKSGRNHQRQFQSIDLACR